MKKSNVLEQNIDIENQQSLLPLPVEIFLRNYCKVYELKNMNEIPFKSKILEVQKRELNCFTGLKLVSNTKKGFTGKAEGFAGLKLEMWRT